MKYIITLMILFSSMVTLSMAKITYEEIIPQLNPCKPYVIETASEPSSVCCAVLKGLDEVASGSKEDRKDICEILKTAANKLPIKIDKANFRLPSICGLHTLTHIDRNMNCNV
ncbi:hypothetical protein LIER_11357 [Lithospermum erythrorhizon]|uniref:Bifunctional inhibitor/plant lipid transfer protein/seed storage helical domain-containing protein n=1 Tax=Lithospermum erythrorhizon TaxID=34254 RepID=A0AAV3PP00_LITER